MKPYLVDVPVKVNIWIRPECQKRQFEIIKQARPSILFIQSDGGRNENEWELIKKNRKLYDEGIDWECTVYKFYEEENLGMYTMGKKVRDFIWEKVDRCIFTEDDQIMSVSFFQYCAELLEKYKDDPRICCINGMNHLGESSEVNSDYFFSRQGSIWGIATWKRVADQYYDFEYGKDAYVLKLLKQRTRHNKILWKRIKAYIKNEFYEGHVAGDEYYLEFAMYGHNQLQIIPKKNLISNIGLGEDSAHSDKIDNLPRGIRRVFNMKTYEIQFPVKHPKYVIPDVEYEIQRNKIMAYNYPIISNYRRIEYNMRLIIKGRFMDKLRKKIQRYKTSEK